MSRSVGLAAMRLSVGEIETRAIGDAQLIRKPGRRSVLGGDALDRHDVARLQTTTFGKTSPKLSDAAGARKLEQPVLNAFLVGFDVDIDVRVWIDPLHRSH